MINIPNILTIIRFLLIPVIAVLLYTKDQTLILVSIALFIIAIITDGIDGYIARKYNQITRFGTFFDPLVDKMLILTMFFIFADLKIIPMWLVLLVLFRELLVTGIRQLASTKEKPVGANWMGKSKFLMQTAVIAYLQLVIYFNLINTNITFFNLTFAYYLTLIITVISLSYALNFVWWHRKEIFQSK